MKMVSERLKILTLIKVIIIVFVITMALIQMKYGCMGTGFIRRIMVLLVIKKMPRKGPHQKILQDGSLSSPGALQKRLLKR